MKELLPHIEKGVQEVLGSLGLFLPELLLGGLFLVLILNDLVLGKRYKNSSPLIAFLGILLITGLTLTQFEHADTVFFGGMLHLTTFALLLKVLFGVGMLFVIAFSVRDFPIRHNEKGWGEFFSLLAAVLLGLNLMAMAGNLLMVLLSIEMVSICSYILVGYTTRERLPAESAMKYVLFGAVCSAVMLYGISLLYGLTGSLQLNGDFAARLADADTLAVGLAVFATLAGFGFKLSMFPLHFWVPDVYEGSTNSVLAFLSTLPKAAGAGILIQFMHASYGFDWAVWLAVLSIITMTLGNFQALWQDNLKRMLGYSSIGHSGFLLMGLAAFSQTGEKAVFYYLVIYTLANIGAFVIIGLLASILHSENVNSYKGLGFKMPVVSVCFVILLMSLIGIPPAGGFVAKFLVFSAAYEAFTVNGSALFILMLIAGAVNTVVALFYYLKIPLQLFLRKSEGIVVMARQQLLLKALIVTLSILTIFLGVFPELILRYFPL